MAVNLNDYKGRIVVTDGAWGTQLQWRGLEPGACPELWNATDPQAVTEVARAYVEAGSEIILTNTFGANRFILARHGAAERAAELAEAGVALSREPTGGCVQVFASMGPTGQILMMGEVDEEEVYAAFAEQAAALERGGADAVVIETMTEPAEVALALRAVRENTSLPAVVSLTYDSGADGTATMMGATPAAVAEQFGGQAGAVGANCGAGPEGFIRVVQAYRAATDLPVWVKANAGLPEMVDGKITYRLTPEAFAQYVPRLVEAGANFIGGCCGTGPEHIRAVREVVDGLRAGR